jgi:hypothetical protein
VPGDGRALVTELTDGDLDAGAVPPAGPALRGREETVLVQTLLEMIWSMRSR